jgi:hypothetical protein
MIENTKSLCADTIKNKDLRQACQSFAAALGRFSFRIYGLVPNRCFCETLKYCSPLPDTYGCKPPSSLSGNDLFRLYQTEQRKAIAPISSKVAAAAAPKPLEKALCLACRFGLEGVRDFHYQLMAKKLPEQIESLCDIEDQQVLSNICKVSLKGGLYGVFGLTLYNDKHAFSKGFAITLSAQLESYVCSYAAKELFQAPKVAKYCDFIAETANLGLTERLRLHGANTEICRAITACKYT